MDCIELKFTALSNIGITEEEERSKKQPLNITIKLFIEYNYKKINDNIDNVLDYDQIHKQAKNLAETSKFNLIETLAKEIADNISHKSLKKIEVKINKPQAILDADVSFIMNKTIV